MPQKVVPPSVHEIAKTINKRLQENQNSTQVASPVIAVREARKIQKRWTKLTGMRDFNYLPGPRRPVINATGIILHTNLGRAPLGPATLERLSQVLAGYTNLEIQLHNGDRGGRTAYLDALFESLVRGYKPVWVNNNAAAVLLALNTLKKQTGLNRMVISRGELVEIGGGFRVPEIMNEAGFELVEVGTTNKTRIQDYVTALKKAPAVICAVHPSNFVMQGFAESVKPDDLIPIARKFKVPVIYDAGTMAGDELRKVRPGFDCITISTDKTLGSVQGGLIMAKPKLQAEILKNPLYRAFRLDKLALTALEVAFEAHAEKTDRKVLPVSEMLHGTAAQLNERAEKFLARFSEGVSQTPAAAAAPLAHFTLKIVDTTGSVGGGSLPGETLKSKGLAIIPREKRAGAPQKIVNMLRQGNPAVLTTVSGGFATLNLLTVFDWQLPDLDQALRRLDEKYGKLMMSQTEAASRNASAAPTGQG